MGGRRPERGLWRGEGTPLGRQIMKNPKKHMKGQNESYITFATHERLVMQKKRKQNFGFFSKNEAFLDFVGKPGAG